MSEIFERVVAPLNAAQAITLWPQIETLLSPVILDEGLYLPVDILIAHLRNEMLIWVSWDGELNRVEAAMVTQIHVFPRKRVCGVPYIAGGGLKNWAKKFEEASEHYARSLGCTRMGGGFRKGWVRIGGYTEVGCMLKKDLSP